MVLAKNKINFLDWVIVHSIFTRREAYWLLTYLKDHPAILDNVHLVEQADKTPRGLVFEQSSQPEDCFCLYKKGSKIIDHEKIFHDIRMNWQVPLYLEVKINNGWENQLYMSVLEDNPFAPWNKELPNHLIRDVADGVESLVAEQSNIGLLQAIDLALDDQDLDLFLKLSKTYQELNQKKE